MIRIGYKGALDTKDKELIKSFINNADLIEFDDNKVPEILYVSRAGGGYGIIHLAILVATFLGAGAAIAFKSFLQSLGSELGKEISKKLTTRFSNETKKEDHPEPLSTILFLVEAKPNVIAIVPLVSPDSLGFNKLVQISEVIDNETQKFSAGQKGLFRVSYDEKTGLWKAMSQGVNTELIYFDEHGEKRVLTW